MDNMYRDNKMLKRLERMATQPYSVRDAQTLLEIEGYKRPSLDFIWKFFRAKRKKRSGRIVKSFGFQDK